MAPPLGELASVSETERVPGLPMAPPLGKTPPAGGGGTLVPEGKQLAPQATERASGLDKPRRNVYNEHRKGAVRRVSSSWLIIRMTAQFGSLGRSFLIVHLFKDSPRNLKRHKDCSTQKAKQRNGFRQRHPASPLSFSRPRGTISISSPGVLQEGPTTCNADSTDSPPKGGIFILASF